MATATKATKLENRILENLIQQGVQPGQRLSPIRKMAKQYKVSYVTAQKALKNLQAKGYLDCRQGDGFYLSVRPDSQGPGATRTGPTLKTMHQEMPPTQLGYKRIGVVLPQWVVGPGGLAIHEIIRSITHYSDLHNWQIELINDNASEAVRPEFLEKIAQRQLDGIVWLQPLPEHKMNLMRLIDKGYEVIATGRRFPELPLTVISADYKDIAEKIADDAATAQRHNIVIMSSSMITDYYCLENVENLVASFKDRDIDIPRDNIFSVPDRFDTISYRTEIQADYLRRHPDIDAIVLLHDHFYSAIEICLKERVFTKQSELVIYDIPAEFMHDQTEVLGVPIRWIRHPFADIGKAIVQHLENDWLTEPSDKTGEKADLTVTLD